MRRRTPVVFTSASLTYANDTPDPLASAASLHVIKFFPTSILEESSMKSIFNQPAGRFSRRKLLGRGAALAATPAFLAAPQSASAAPPAAAGKLQLGSGIYQSIGVRPLINCRGTLTVISGSLELPEVRAAKDAAAQHYVQLDEMMEAVGQRLAELTGAEWGMVSSGCAAALAHATTACVTGGN